MLKEFREFAIKGNVIDMAVGIMIGAAFGTVVSSIVNDLLLPPIALLTGPLDFSNKFAILKHGGGAAGPYHTLAQAKAAGAVVVAYGQFLSAAISFLIVSLVLFFVVRWMNRLRRPDTPPAPSTKACPFCRSHIDMTATRCPNCTSHLEQSQD